MRIYTVSYGPVTTHVAMVSAAAHEKKMGTCADEGRSCPLLGFGRANSSQRSSACVSVPVESRDFFQIAFIQIQKPPIAPRRAHAGARRLLELGHTPVPLYRRVYHPSFHGSRTRTSSERPRFDESAGADQPALHDSCASQATDVPVFFFWRVNAEYSSGGDDSDDSSTDVVTAGCARCFILR
ncbi:hypothetical protein BC828DRAFT_162828 [Blastocladiella britannica]|nr:hypothetical protein BC828DRAFT_162828 [Blastocladiella britannica]